MDVEAQLIDMLMSLVLVCLQGGHQEEEMAGARPQLGVLVSEWGSTGLTRWYGLWKARHRHFGRQQMRQDQQDQQEWLLSRRCSF
jgi:hypothetical protein